MHCDVLAKPIGLIRVFLMVLGILALVSLLDFRGSYEYSHKCPGEQWHSGGFLVWQYPFRLPDEKIMLLQCNATKSGEEIPTTEVSVFYISFKSQAQFFGFVAGFSAFISGVWLIVYVGSWMHYDMDPALSTGDIGISLFMSLFWLCADCAWASALEILKAATSTQQINRTIQGNSECQSGAQCVLSEKAEGYTRGSFALAVGFINFFLWIGAAFLAYRQRRLITIERRRLLGETRGEAQAQAHAQAAAFSQPRVIY